jgi:hypothetical protein
VSLTVGCMCEVKKGHKWVRISAAMKVVLTHLLLLDAPINSSVMGLIYAKASRNLWIEGDAKL